MITQDRLRILARELGVRQGYAEKNYLSQRESLALSVRRECSDILLSDPSAEQDGRELVNSGGKPPFHWSF